MAEASDNHEVTASIGGRTINNQYFAYDIDRLAGNEQELISLAEQLNKAIVNFVMEISGEKQK